MINAIFFTVILMIGTVLMATGCLYIIYKTNTDKKLQRKVAGGLIVLIIGILLIAIGIDNSVERSTKGTPIEFSELKNGQYFPKEIPSNWRIVKIYSKKPEKNGRRVIKDFPANFDFSAKKFTKYEVEVTYPKKSSP